MRQLVRGLAALAAGLIWVHPALAEPSPVAVRITALEAKSCVSEPELRAALAQAGIATAPPAEDEPMALQLEIAGTPEHLSVQLRGLGDATTTLMAPATCTTATDVVRAFLVSTLAPIPATPPAPSEPAPVAPEPKLEAKTLFDAVRAELARRGLQLVLEGVTLAIERDQSRTWFARIARIDTPAAPQTIALGNFDDPSELRIAAVSDLIVPVIQLLSSYRYRPPPKPAAIQRALQRVDSFPSDAAAGAIEVAMGGALLAALLAGHAPNVHFSFDSAENAFFSSSASAAVLGGGASFLVADDYRRAVIGVTSLAASGALFTGLTLVREPSVPTYAPAAIAAGSYGSAVLFGLNGVLRPPPIARLKAWHRELRRRAITDEEIPEIEATLAKTEPPLPNWLTFTPLMAGGLVATFPWIADGFEDDERMNIAICGASVAALGAVFAFVPSNFSRYQRELQRAGVSDIAIGLAPGTRLGLGISGRF